MRNSEFEEKNYKTEELLRLAKQWSAPPPNNAYGELLNATRPLLLNFATRFSYHSPEEITSDVTLRLLKIAPDYFINARHFINVARLATKRCAIDKTKRNMASVLDNGMVKHDETFARSVSSKESAPYQYQITAELEHTIRARLTEQETLVFQLTMMDEIPQVEAAAILGIQERQIRRIIRNIRDKARDLAPPSMQI